MSRNCWRQLSYALKNQLVASKAPLLLAGSLWHKGAYNRTLHCMQTIPYAIKNQRGASKIFCVPKPLLGGFGIWMPELVLYGIIELAEQHYDPLDQ